MSSFAVFMNQSEEGCDYTIGCGSRLDFLSATDREEARAEAIQVASRYFKGDHTPHRIYLVQVVDGIDSDELSEEEADDVERVEYERLREKFGD